jgi:hypothetical protein
MAFNHMRRAQMEPVGAERNVLVAGLFPREPGFRDPIQRERVTRITGMLKVSVAREHAQTGFTAAFDGSASLTATATHEVA